MGYRKLRNISYRHRRQVPGLSDCVLGVVAVACARFWSDRPNLGPRATKLPHFFCQNLQEMIFFWEDPAKICEPIHI